MPVDTWTAAKQHSPLPPPVHAQAVCLAFGTEGFFWCPLGPLAKPGPTWWKVGFLSSQLPRALPTAATISGGGSSDDALLLLGWWVPEQ